MILVEASKCTGCNACIRTCPVTNANRYDGSIVHINTDACIQCGECVKHCDHGARYYSDDLDVPALLDLLKHKKVSLIVAPSIKTALDGKWRHVLQYLCNQGAKNVYDVSFGADICTYMHVAYMKANPSAKIISQPCAAIVNYVEKHKPELIPRLSPVQSPMLCTAIYAKKYLGDNNIMVGVSPCIAKSDEFKNTGVISYNITFKKLNEYFSSNKVVLPTGRSEFEFTKIRGYDGAFYPIPGGLKDCLHELAPDLDVATSEGVQKVYGDLDDYLKASASDLPSVYDVLSCEFGCNSGAGAKENFNAFQARNIMGKVRGFAHKYNMSKRFPRKIFKNLKLEDFVRTYTNRCVDQKFKNTELDEVFTKLGKTTEAERNYNCHACGYKTCKDMAFAIMCGNNTYINCIQYEKQYLKQIHSNIQTSNENLSNSVIEIKDELSNLREYVIPIAGKSSEHLEKNSLMANNIKELSDKMDQIVESMSDIHLSIQNITENIDSYSKIMTDIQNISEQTHILAINASIEAARVGEAGKGFSIVASEVRVLAQKSNDTVQRAEANTINIMESLKDITDVTAKIEKEIKATGESTGGVVEAINAVKVGSEEISDNVVGVTKIVDKLNATVDSIVASITK